MAIFFVAVACASNRLWTPHAWVKLMTAKTEIENDYEKKMYFKWTNEQKINENVFILQ